MIGESKKVLPSSGTPKEASSCGLMKRHTPKGHLNVLAWQDQVESKEGFLEGAQAKLVVLDSSKQESLAAKRTRYRGIDSKGPKP